MQLGARWRAGEQPHRSVPAALHSAIASAESAHPDAEAWTLTWLEGRPVCELDDVHRIGVGPGGEIVSGSRGGVREAFGDESEDEDDWLS